MSTAKVEEQQVAVSNFLKEHRPLLKDPELGDIALETIFVQGAELLQSVSDDMVRMAKTMTDVTNSLSEALNERPRVAPEIARREKKYKHYIARFEKMKKAFNELESFVAEVKARRDAKDIQAEVPESLETPKKHPWWKCILGIGSLGQVMRKPPYKGSPATPESDPEDYQKLLDHYEELLVPLEDLFRTRAEYPVPYDIEPELLIRWQETRETLINKMAWCNRNMDAIERRNPHGISRELLDKRENIASRRGELGE